MLRHIFRQRRRLLFGCLFFWLTLAPTLVRDLSAEAWNQTGPAWILPVTLFLTFVIVTACFFVVVGLFVLLLPKLRILVETVFVIIFLNTVLPGLLPGLYASPLMSGVLQMACAIGVFILFYGEFMDRFRFWLDHTSERHFISPKSAEELWAELVPGASPVQGHWDSRLHAVLPVDGEPDAFEVQYSHGASLYEHQTMTFLERDAPLHARYHHVGEVDPRNRSLLEGTFSIRITPLESGGCRVTLIATRQLLLLRAALLMWFDDHLGDQADHLYARHRGYRDWTTTGTAMRSAGKLA
ncbi:hypothetical protein [Sulfitobacter sp. JB4-11]|uniref:hypothetical protein n=1 Tax=Sulfitobacter rhodophyticola TaxID=3238304 RepID=UPI0035193AAC